MRIRQVLISIVFIVVMAGSLQAADYYFYVGGTGDFSNSSDTNGGGAVSTIAMADVMGADGGPLAADTGATGTDATPSVITLDGAILSTASIADSELTGIFVYLSGTNCTSGCYRIQDNNSTDDTITLYRNASSGGAMSALVVNIGGAFLLIGDNACDDGALAEIPDTNDLWDEHITECNYTDSGSFPVTKAGDPFTNISVGDIVHISAFGDIEKMARVAEKPDDSTLRFNIDLGAASAGDVEVFTNCSSSITIWCNRDFDGVGANPYLIRNIRVGTGFTAGRPWKKYGSTLFNQWILIKGFRTTPGDMDRGGAYYGDRIELDINQNASRDNFFEITDTAQNVAIENFLMTNHDKTTLYDSSKYRFGIQPLAGDSPEGGLVRNCYFQDLQWGISALANISGSSAIWKPLAVEDCIAEDCLFDDPNGTDEGGGFYGWETLFVNCVTDNCHDGFMLRDGATAFQCVTYDTAECGFEIIARSGNCINCVSYNGRDGFRPYFDNDSQINMVNCVALDCTDNLKLGTLNTATGQQNGSYGLARNNISLGGTNSNYLDALVTSPTWDATAGTFIDDVIDNPRFMDLASYDFRRSGTLNRGISTPGNGKTTIGAWQPNAIPKPFGRRRSLQSRYD